MKKYLLPILVAAAIVGFVVLHIVSPHLYRNLITVHLAKLWHLALFLAMWLAAYFAGRGLLRLLTKKQEVLPEVAAAAGVVIFATAALVAAACHVAYRWPVRIITLAVLAAGMVPWLRRLRAEPGRVRRWWNELELGPAAWLVGGAVLVFPLALAAAQPPLYWDALTYHLAVPSHYAAAHGFVYLPYNIYASMPLGATMFYMWAMLWDGVICANGSYFAVSVLVLALTYRLARIWLGQFYAALASFLVFFTPVFFVVMPGAHVDHFLMLYVAAALYLYFAPRAAAAPAGRAAAVGVFLGAALSVKYTSVYALAALAPAVIYDLVRRRERLRDVALTLGVAFVFVVPWLVKAYVERGSPFFPLFYDVFGGRDFSPAQAQRLVSWQHGMGAGRGWLDYLLLPYRVSVDADFNYRSFAGIYLPYLLPLAALAAVFFRRAWKLVAFGWLYFAAWALGPQQLRFFDPGFTAMAVAAAGAVAAAEGAWGSRARNVWRAAVCAVVLFTGVSYNVGCVFQTLEGYDYLAGQGFVPFLRDKCGFYAAQEFINERTPPDAKVLMLFTNHTLYLKRAAVYDSFFEASPFLLAADAPGAEPQDLYRLARRWGVTHVHVFHMFEEDSWPYYSKRAKSVLYEFLGEYCISVYRDPLNDVYELLPPGVK